jgi:D-3-phosphoglycerate dehydrogenase
VRYQLYPESLMPDPQHFTIVVTSDRYDFELERAMLREATDLAVDLRAAVCRTEDEIIAAGQDADALLVSTREAVTRRVLEHLPRVKVISRYGVGLDNVDLDAAADQGIVVTHYPGYCTNEVADHALALILALNRRIVELDRDVHAGAWARHQHKMSDLLRGPIPPLRELTLGLVGFGRIGRAVAERARGFGLTLLAADPYIDAAIIAAEGAQPATLAELLSRSDIVSLHSPLTPETRGIIGDAELRQMKPSAVLVNTARGPLIQLDALATALQDGTIAGAALDVVDPEPLPLDSPLMTLPNVILTPHAAYYSERSAHTVRVETLNEALAVLRGQRPRTIANPRVLDRVELTPVM